MPQYSWSGVNRHGQQQMGRADWHDLAAEVERMFSTGWRSLRVADADCPVPPPLGAHTVAEIGPDPLTGRRTWFAEIPAGAREPHAFEPGVNPRWCKRCGWAASAYVHASEEDRRAFDAARFLESTAR